MAANAHAAPERAHQDLIDRDYVIGLEATITRLTRELAQERAEHARAVAEFAVEREQLQTRVAEIVADREAIWGSTTWRAGRLVTTPVRIAKRGK